MANHPNRSKAVGPRCLNCGDPLRKQTRTVSVERHDSSVPWRPTDDFSRTIRPEVHLLNKADCQRNSNMEVLSVNYWPATTPEGKRVMSFTEWDGQSYVTTAGYFCNGPCAQSFARHAAKAGYRSS